METFGQEEFLKELLQILFMESPELKLLLSGYRDL